jgi:hypothetical protein
MNHSVTFFDQLSNYYLPKKVSILSSSGSSSSSGGGGGSSSSCSSSSSRFVQTLYDSCVFKI